MRTATISFTLLALLAGQPGRAQTAPDKAADKKEPDRSQPLAVL